MHRYPTECPTCGSDTVITEVGCTRCDTVVQGSYTGCTFCQLPEDDLRFVELFIASRGNIKEMERETGLGYWTLRGKLDDVIKTLGLDARPRLTVAEIKAERERILAAVSDGTLSVAEAEQQINDLAKRKADPGS